MVIQQILFPKKDVCKDWGMYFHGSKVTTGNFLKLAKDGVLSLQSYFNSFSIGKWKKYTNIDNLSLHLKMKGDVKVHAFNAVGRTYHKRTSTDTQDSYHYKKALRQEIDVEVKKVDDGIIISFPNIDYEGIIYVKLEALSDVVLLGGEYTTDTKALNDVSFAVCICTHRREEFVTRNVNSIIDDIINNKNSVLNGKLEVFISDNGQTLPLDTFASDKVHLYPNKNVGGAGGFTRAMIEAVLRGRKNKPSHVILMDDDIDLDTVVLERNYMFLRFLNHQFLELMIGGELFDAEKKYLQFEAGAYYSNVTIQKYNQGWDLRNGNAVAANEVENKTNYNAWPYCCIPVSYIREDNLPLPVFIHYDDIEYGMRNNNSVILLNGLCVWHPHRPFIASPLVRYYETRNELICMCDKKDAPTKSMIMKHITYSVIGCMLRYRYNVIYSIFEGLEDYYRGPQTFINTDPLAKHQKITRYNYEYIKPEEIDGVKVEGKSKRITGADFIKSALYYILPSLDYVKVCTLDNEELALRARHIYLYDREKEAGFITSRSYSDTIRILIKYMKMMRMISAKHDSVTDKWAKSKKDYTSLEFYKRYLDIN